MSLPELLDSKAIQAELNVSRAAAEHIMEAVPIVRLPGLRKVYCRRRDVQAYIDENTISVKS